MADQQPSLLAAARGGRTCAGSARSAKANFLSDARLIG